MSGLARGQTTPDQQAAVLRLIQLWHEGRVSLWTSPEAKKEIDKIPDEKHRAPHDAIYAFLAKVPTFDEQLLVPRVVRAGSRLFGPHVVKDSDFAFLEGLLPDRADALHVFQAFKNGIDYFVTRDATSILPYAPAIAARLGIRALLPSALVAEIDT